ncbi:MAG: hypothetical protein E4H02_08885 [Lentisphaerales bacterium]|nr:MAG: hypothetical protein E4H02_08885 [Lentisphaerales bacterium]
MASLRSTLPAAVAVALLLQVPQQHAYAQTNNVDQNPAGLAEAILDLGHPRFAEREQATRYLWSQGPKADAALRQAAGSDDPEVSVRATQILKWIRAGLMPDMPENITALVRRYPLCDETTKQDILLELLTDHDHGIPSATALLRNESDNRVHKRIYSTASAAVLDAVRAMLLRDDYDIPLELFRLGALADNDTMRRALVLFVLERGTVAEEIQHWERLPGPDSPVHMALLYLYRAAGDQINALRHAELCGRDSILRTILQEQGAWQRLARIQDEKPRPTDLEWLGYRAAYHRLAGHTNQFEHTISDIEALALDDVEKNAWYGAEALMLNDCHERAIALVVKSRRLGQAAELLFSLHRYDDIIALAADTAGVDTNQLNTLSLITNIVTRTVLPSTQADAGAAKELASQEAGPLSEADALAANGEWQAAATLYGDLSKQQPGAPLPLFLQGLALSRSNRTADGKRLMSTASLLAVDPPAQYLLATALSKRAHTKESDRQWELAFRTSACGSWQWGESLRRFAIPNARRIGDHATAAFYAELNRLRCLDKSSGLLEVTGYLNFSSKVAVYRVLAELESGNIDLATARMHDYQRMFPGDIELAIMLRPRLEALGQQPIANELFDTTFAFLDALCRKYPNMGHIRNATAWLTARCRRRLDDGLTHAQRAVQLEPRSAAFIDTLAEVLFQLRKNDEALELMRKFVELEPDEPYFRRQLTRFEKNDTATDPE